MSLHDFQRIQVRLKSIADPVSFLVNLFAHAPVGFAVWSADGQTLLTNKAFVDLFGSEPPPEYNVLKDDLLAKTGMLGLFQSAFAGETVHVPTFWYDARDLQSVSVSEGRRVAISMTIFPLFGANGEIDYVAATYKDETEVRRLNENLEQMVQERTQQLSIANRELEAFSYSVAHDLRAPLRGMNGFASLLLDDYEDKLDADGVAYLHKIRANTLLMSELIDALLLLASVARSELKLAFLDLSAVARNVLSELASSSEQEQERRMDVIVQDGLHARIDPTLARTLFENLLGNAWKFTGGLPTPRIEVGATQIDDAQVFFVRDNGAGFDMAHSAKLFVPFQRLHTPREFPGTGVGLATSQRIVDRHGGRIWAESQIGEGATFFFTLPTLLNGAERSRAIEE